VNAVAAAAARPLSFVSLGDHHGPVENRFAAVVRITAVHLPLRSSGQGSDGGHHHAAANARCLAMSASRRSRPGGGVGPGVRAGRADGTGRIPARSGPGRVRVLAGPDRGGGTRRLHGHPAAVGRPRLDPADAPAHRHPAGAGGRGRTGPEPGVVPGLRPATGGRRGGHLRLLPAASRGLGGRLATACGGRDRPRRGHVHGHRGRHRAGLADPAGSAGLGPRRRAPPGPAGCRPARRLYPARPRRVG
jgi:hypothetical protein